jgi:hypothetical protein
MGYVVGHLSYSVYFNKRNTQENLKPWSVETLEESFSSQSGKKDLRQETSGKPPPPPYYLSQNFVNFLKNI